MDKTDKLTVVEQEGADGYVKIDRYNADTVNRIADLYGDILAAWGENPAREGLLKTSESVAKS